MFATIFFLIALVTLASAKPPNIIFILTDDQDQTLGGSFPHPPGVTPMPKTDDLLVKRGATALNWFVHTSVCCPSRAQILTGRYFHNIKQTGQCTTGEMAGSCCMHVPVERVNAWTFPVALQRGGYTTGMFGKYLNICPAQAPPGYDTWFANGGSEYFAPAFYVKNVPNMTDGTKKYGNSDYSTDVIGQVFVDWLDVVARGSKPFFGYIGVKSCHEPYLPAKQYANRWQSGWPATEPRNAAWNASASIRASHHAPVSTEPPLNINDAREMTRVFKDRWRTLMSVDDMIAKIIAKTDVLGVTTSTYFLFTSDHGFHLGHFNLADGKRHLYDMDTRVHMVIRGPGIRENSQVNFMATHVDIGATILGFAGVTTSAADATMDGRSVAPLLVNKDDEAVPEETRLHVGAVDQAAYAAGWRDTVFFEFYYLNANKRCTPTCFPRDDVMNNYIALRSVSGKYGNIAYGWYQNSSTSDVFFTRRDFEEFFNVGNDPLQLKNVANVTQASILEALRGQVQQWYKCAGSSCL